MVFRFVPAQEPAEVQPAARMAFVAAKRSFKRAPDRNFIKRRMREAYRSDKVRLYHWLAARGTRLEGMLIYTGRELPTQAQITTAWRKLLRRLDPDFFGG